MQKISEFLSSWKRHFRRENSNGYNVKKRFKKQWKRGNRFQYYTTSNLTSLTFYMSVFILKILFVFSFDKIENDFLIKGKNSNLSIKTFIAFHYLFPNGKFVISSNECHKSHVIFQKRFAPPLVNIFIWKFAFQESPLSFGKYFLRLSCRPP